MTNESMLRDFISDKVKFKLVNSEFRDKEVIIVKMDVMVGMRIIRFIEFIHKKPELSKDRIGRITKKYWTD